MREFNGTMGKFISILSVIIVIIHLYGNYTGAIPFRVFRSLHLIFFLPLSFILFPATKNSPKNKPTIIDIILAILSIIVSLYILMDYEYLDLRWIRVHPVYLHQVVLGIINVLLVIEAARRAVIPAIAVVGCIALAYVFIGPYFKGIFYHSGFPFPRVIEMLYLDNVQGIYGMFTGISATYIILFIIFAAILMKVGAGQYFIDLAIALTGHQIGGPAKVAVISSAMFGTISGMSTANVVATGSFTIPMMKKLGYRPQFAGSVEATASTGGQIMPPIMGAGAFIMAEMLGIGYLRICIAAAVPAILYFFCAIVMVHLVAMKEGLKTLTIQEIKDIDRKKILKNSYYFIPLAGLFYILIIGYSPLMAGFAGIVLTILISFFKKETFLTPKRLFQSFEEATKNTIVIAIACAIAGIIVAVILNTGLAISFGSALLYLSGGKLLPSLIMLMILCIILGMGLPTTAAYVIASSLAAPALLSLGIDLLPSHLFCFYFAIIAELTPPVAVTSYVAAGIAKADPIKTAYEAFKLSVIGFVVPYAFIYNNSLLLMGGNYIRIIVSVIFAILGSICLAAALQGYLIKHLGYINRVFLILAGLFLIYRISLPISIISLLVLLITIIYQRNFLLLKQ